MAVAVFVGGAVLGAAFGEVFAVLHDTVKNVGSKVLIFKSELKSLKSNLDLLAPVVDEISRLNRELGLPEEETKSLIEDMKKAEELIRTCSAISGWNFKFQAHHSKQLTELDKAIVKFCQVHMPAQIKRDTLQILKDTSQISQILEDKSSQILGNTSQISQILGDTSWQISQILGNTSQISHILESHLPKERERDTCYVRCVGCAHRLLVLTQKFLVLLKIILPLRRVVPKSQSTTELDILPALDV